MTEGRLEVSWSFSFTTNGESFDTSATSAINEYKERQANEYSSPVTPEQEDQIAAARKAAEAILDSGAVGSKTHTFSVTLGGHANPGHEPVSGWANDTVSVSVYQSAPEAAKPEAAK